MSTQATESMPLVDADAVAAYLRAHPDFFVKREALLDHLYLPHGPAGTVSLVERQVARLRQHNTELVAHLQELLANARDNDHLFEKTQRLLFNLLESQDLGDLVDAVSFSFAKDFEIHFTRIYLFGDAAHLSAGAARVCDGAALRSLLTQLQATSRVYTGQVSAQAARSLFDEDAGAVGSVALVPLVNAASCWQPQPMRARRTDQAEDSLFGVIAIANRDPDFYRSSIGTLFLGFIGEVLNRLMPPLLTGANAQGR